MHGHLHGLRVHRTDVLDGVPIRQRRTDEVPHLREGRDTERLLEHDRGAHELVALADLALHEHVRDLRDRGKCPLSLFRHFRGSHSNPLIVPDLAQCKDQSS